MADKRKYPYFQIDAFTSEQYLGNPAGVVPLRQWLPDKTMQRIAANVGLSDTAFFVPDHDLYHLRWFSPSVEVDLCGHATLAAAHLVFTELEQGRSNVTFETRSGPLHVAQADRVLRMDFPRRATTRTEVTSLWVHLLGREPKELHRTDNGVTMCVFENEEIVRLLKPDLAALTNTGQCLLATAPGITADFVSRYFAPTAGVSEDPVTGSAHCISAPFWAQRLNRTILSAHQVSKRGGALVCEVREDRIILSGQATLVSRSEITVPEL